MDDDAPLEGNGFAELNRLSGDVVDAAYHVHRALGPGLTERVYVTCLERTLRKRGLDVQREVSFPLLFDGEVLPDRFRVDLLVENKLLVEVKAVEHVLPLHHAQVYTYVRLSGRALGLLLNFNAPLMREGIVRKVCSANLR